MPLFIRDPEVDAMVAELVRLKKARGEAEVVRDALREELKRTRAAIALEERIAHIHEKLDREIGPPDPNFDMKAYTDEMWGEEDE